MNNIELQSYPDGNRSRGLGDVSLSVEVGPQPNGTEKRLVTLNEKKELTFAFDIRRKYNQHLIPPDWKAAERHGVSKLQAGSLA